MSEKGLCVLELRSSNTNSDVNFSKTGKRREISFVNNSDFKI